MIFPNKNVQEDGEFDFFIQNTSRHPSSIICVDIEYLLNNHYSMMTTAGQTSGLELVKNLSIAYKHLQKLMPHNKLIVYFSDVLEPDVRNFDKAYEELEPLEFSDVSIPSFKIWQNNLNKHQALFALNMYLFDRLTFCTCVWRKNKTALQCIFEDFMYGANFVLTSNSAAFSYALLHTQQPPDVYYFVLQKHFNTFKVMDSDHFIQFIRRAYTTTVAPIGSDEETDCEEDDDLPYFALYDEDYSEEPKPRQNKNYPWEIVYCVIYAFLCNAKHCPYGRIGRYKKDEQKGFNCSADKLMKRMSFCLKRDGRAEILNRETGELNRIFITDVVNKLSKRRKDVNLTKLFNEAETLIRARTTKTTDSQINNNNNH